MGLYVFVVALWSSGIVVIGRASEGSRAGVCCSVFFLSSVLSSLRCCSVWVDGGMVFVHCFVFVFVFIVLCVVGICLLLFVVAWVYGLLGRWSLEEGNGVVFVVPLLSLGG